LASGSSSPLGYQGDYGCGLLSLGVSFTIELKHVVSGVKPGNILRETALKTALLRGLVEIS